MSATVSPFTLGNQTRVVMIHPVLNQIDFGIITSFDAKPLHDVVTVKPYNSPTIKQMLPNGHNLHWTCERTDTGLEQLLSYLETTHWSGGTIQLGSVTQQITNTDGNVTTYTFNQVCIFPTDLGKWVQNMAVSQSVDAFASTRTP
jgi:uncharacterized protein YndB with AHSA1/START domain